MELRSQTNNVTTMQVGPWSQAETYTTIQVGPWPQAENLNDDAGGTVAPG